jgi:N-acetylglucosamine-6-phosphate deacetylase
MVLIPGRKPSDSVIVVSDSGIIEAIEPSNGGSPDLDRFGYLIVPGFIDVHVHGGGGADFMDGTEDAARAVARTHARFGTTTLLATTLTASREDIDRCVTAACAVMDHPADNEARVVGLHLEGPYICAAKRGAQPLAPIRPPDWDEMRGWIELASGRIKLITLAPETPGVLEFIGSASRAGVRVSVGHTSATYDQTRAAIDVGATHATHLFNAMPPLHHREPGPIAALLEDERVLVELIADGVHVHPAVATLIARAAGVERVILITDAMSGAAMPDGEYALGGTAVTVKEGTAKFADGTLAGSVLTMDRAFANIQRFAQVDSAAAARMTSANAAEHLGLSELIGCLEPGKRADLAIIDPETGVVDATMREGRWIWRR